MNLNEIAAVGMQQDAKRLEAISQNIANTLTPGFKRHMALAQATSPLAPGTASRVPGSALSSTLIDANAGTLRATGVASDVVIEGEGFFELAAASGHVYTRQGSLHVDAQGHLVGAQEAPILGDSGEIVLTDAPFSIDASGAVHQGERVVARLRVVTFDRPEKLLPLGHGVYEQGGAQITPQRAAVHVRTGFIENSNVNSAQEMVRLSETLRHYESLQRAVQGYDDALGTALRKLGEY